MINIIHQISKWAAILWTCLCGLVGCLFVFGLLSGASETAGSDPGNAAGFMGVGFFMFLILGAMWFFPTLTAIVAMYFTRPQAWGNQSKALPESAPIA